MKFPGLPNSSAARQAVLVSGLMMAWQLAAKTTRDSLFLSVFPFTALPPAVGAAAICSIAVAFFSTKLLHRYGPYRLIPAGFLAGAVLHLAEWILFPMFPRPLAAFVYLHVLALGPVMLSGFWALASERFDPREARRRYGQITAFGTLGSLAGGLMAERVAVWSSSLDLLILLAVLQLACSLALFRFAPSHSTEKAYDVPSIPEMISGAPYLIGLAVFVLLVSMSAAGLDFLFRAKAVATFGQGAGLTRFFAIFNTATSVITFASQATLSRLWMKRFGPGGTVSVLPVAVTGASVISFFVPGAIAISISRGLEQMLRGSFYRSGYELFYTPMPAAERRSAKAVIDIGADRLGEGLAAAAIQLFLVLPSEISFRVVLAATAIWSAGAAWLAFRLDHAYVTVLEKGLARQTVVIQPEEAEDAVTRSIVLRSGSSIHAIAAREAGLEHSLPPGDLTLRILAELRSSDPLRARAALLSIDLREPLLVSQVIKLLGRDETARAAHDALSRTVDQIAGQLADRLADPAENEKVRRRIPRVLAGSKNPLAWQALLRQLRDERFEIRQRCGRALEKMLQANPEFRPEPAVVFEIVGNELAAGRGVLPKRAARPAQAAGDDPEFLLVDEVLRERATQLTTHVATLLGLALPPQSVRLAFRALHTEDAKLRGIALEYLDSVLPKGIREELAAHIEGPVARPDKSGTSAEEALANLLDESPSILARLEDLKFNAPDRKKSSSAPG